MADPLARNGSLTELPGANELTAVLPVNHVQHENDAQAPAGDLEAVPLIPRGHRNRDTIGAGTVVTGGLDTSYACACCNPYRHRLRILELRIGRVSHISSPTFGVLDTSSATLTVPFTTAVLPTFQEV